jgi:hypothetical protein
MNPTGTWLQWDVTSIKIGETWLATYDVSCNVPLTDQNVTVFPVASVDYLTWDNRIVSAPIPSDYITCLVPLQPYITDVVIEPGGVNVTWIPVPGADYYEVYGGLDQTSLDLDLTDVIDTLTAPQTWWLDTSSLLSYDEFYYVIRAVDTDTVPWTRSMTSNTAGYYTLDFVEGLNTVSLPLQPFGALPLDTIRNGMGATSISMLDSNDDWQTYTSSPTPNAQMGIGYVVDLPVGSPSSYIFTGEPAAMILFTDDYGWDFDEGALVAASISAKDVLLSWPSLGPGIEYYVYWSAIRDGFYINNFAILNGGLPLTTTSYIDPGAVSAPGEDYYLIVPHDPVNKDDGASTYSIGIFTADFNGNEMIGLPLKPFWGDMSADWYVDQIPNCLGMVYLEDGIWKAHFKEFPEGVYDTIVEYGKGYEISVYASDLFDFIGW